MFTVSSPSPYHQATKEAVALPFIILDPCSLALTVLLTVPLSITLSTIHIHQAAKEAVALSFIP